MPSKNIPGQSRKPGPVDKASKSKGELGSKDLDKVTGGSRPTTIGNTKAPGMGA
jgi:hypothetical protein